MTTSGVSDALVERVARAIYAAHHHSGPTEAAYGEPNWGRGGFKTERVVWDACARAAIAAIPPEGRVEELEAQIAAFIKTLAEAAANSGSDFNQGVVRGLEIAAAQFEHGHAKQHVPLLAAMGARDE